MGVKGKVVRQIRRVPPLKNVDTMIPSINYFLADRLG